MDELYAIASSRSPNDESWSKTITRDKETGNAHRFLSQKASNEKAGVVGVVCTFHRIARLWGDFSSQLKKNL